MSGNLTEIGMGLDAWEATKARITATFNKEHQVWVATATIRAQDIDADRRKWIADEVDGMLKGIVQLKDEVFTATYLFDVHGQGIWEVHSWRNTFRAKRSRTETQQQTTNTGEGSVCETARGFRRLTRCCTQNRPLFFRFRALSFPDELQQAFCYLPEPLHHIAQGGLYRPRQRKPGFVPGL